MNLETAKSIIYEDEDGYKAVTHEEIYSQSRWQTFFEQVFEKEEDGTFWKIYWARGSTEYQDDGPEILDIKRVFPKTKTITVYE